MTLFPDAQKKAQAEIDAVIGPDRLPSYADRDSLPYVEALTKEIMRWNAVVPTGIFVFFHCILSLTRYLNDSSSPPCH
jgi:cytochrome P450